MAGKTRGGTHSRGYGNVALTASRCESNALRARRVRCSRHSQRRTVLGKGQEARSPPKGMDEIAAEDHIRVGRHVGIAERGRERAWWLSTMPCSSRFREGTCETFWALRLVRPRICTRQMQTSAPRPATLPHSVLSLTSSAPTCNATAGQLSGRKHDSVGQGTRVEPAGCTSRQHGSSFASSAHQHNTRHTAMASQPIGTKKAPVAVRPLNKRRPTSNKKPPAPTATVPVSQKRPSLPTPTTPATSKSWLTKGLGAASAGLSSAASAATSGIGNAAGAAVTAAGNGVAGAGKGAGVRYNQPHVSPPYASSPSFLSSYPPSRLYMPIYARSSWRITHPLTQRACLLASPTRPAPGATRCANTATRSRMSRVRRAVGRRPGRIRWG